MKRLIEQSACVHRQFNVCTFLLDSGVPCPGGTSRQVEINYEAAKRRCQLYACSDQEAGEMASLIVGAALGEGS